MGGRCVLHRDPAGAGAQAPCVTEGRTGIGYAGMWPWRMGLPRRWRLQGCDFQQQKALSPGIQLEDTIGIW